MVWLITFTFLSWASAAGLFLPGVVLWYIPATASTGELFLRTSRAVAIIAALTAPVVNFLAMQFAV
jgi:hypothetical protein